MSRMADKMLKILFLTVYLSGVCSPICARSSASVAEMLEGLATATPVELNTELNAARIDSLWHALAKGPSWSRTVRLRLQLGEQLLRAGRTQEAIDELSLLQEELARRKSPAPLRATWPVRSKRVSANSCSMRPSSLFICATIFPTDSGTRASSNTRLAQSEPRIPSFFSPGSRTRPGVSSAPGW